MDTFSNVATGLSTADAGTLVLLALVDSTSTGTLVLPLVLLLFLPTVHHSRGNGRGTGVQAPTPAGSAPPAPGTSTPAPIRSTPAPSRANATIRVVVYLMVIAAFYWLVGVAIMAGFQGVAEPVGQILSSRAGAVMLVAVAVGLLILSWWVDPKVIEKRGGDPEAGTRRWVQRAQHAVGSWKGVGALALGAGLIELATMLPYLAAMGGLAQADLGVVETVVVLALYCLIMIAPALLLCLVHAVLGSRIERPVAALRDWAVRAAPTTLAWILGIVGVVILVRTLPGLLGA
ncbi:MULTISPECIES: GAP family protein [Kocuria]|uniref:GAP family protein n=1 Tax=Kocuria subflava TaxID=1736139 RepID=A0A846TWB1_9MICC|nr:MULTISPECIES: GAP family protein [Kocuria]NKE09974.1 hypothetical protein [Kocuria subflava]